MKHWKDLLVWQKSHELVLSVYRLTSDFPKSERYGIVDQIRRAAASIPANTVEGFERESSSEFHQFIVIAKASSAEVRSQLYVALDIGYISTHVFDEINTLAQEVALDPGCIF